MADTPAIAIAEPVDALRRAQQGKSYWKRVWERLRRDKVTLAMAAILASLLIMVIFAPWFTVHDPYQGSVLRRLKPIGFPGHWLGTDEVGRDLWSRMVYGGRLSLLAGVMPVFLALLVGGFLGILAGYAGGLVNSAIMRLIDVLYAFPSVLLAIAITGILGAGLGNTILALTIAFVPPLVRISEAVTTQARNLDFVEAARASGAGTLKILQYHILNNVLGPILVYADEPDQHRHHLGRRAVVSRSRRHPAERRMGADAEQSAPGPVGRPGYRRVAGGDDLHHLDVLQSAQRRAAPSNGRAVVTPLLAVDGLTKHFPLRGGLLNRDTGSRASGRRRFVLGRRRRNARHRRQIRLRQVDDGEAADASRAADRGTIAFDGKAIGAGEDAVAPRSASADADGVPGFVCLAEPAAAGFGIDRVWPAGPWLGQVRGAVAGDGSS